MYEKSNMETYITICKINSQPMGMCCMAQETQTGTLSIQRGGMGGRWEGGSEGRGYMYMAVSCWGLTENNRIL